MRNLNEQACSAIVEAIFRREYPPSHAYNLALNAVKTGRLPLSSSCRIRSIFAHVDIFLFLLWERTGVCQRSEFSAMLRTYSASMLCRKTASNGAVPVHAICDPSAKSSC